MLLVYREKNIKVRKETTFNIDKNQPIINEISDELQHCIELHIKAMNMVSSIYGNLLSHEQFMDKTEEFLCALIEEEKKSNLA